MCFISTSSGRLDSQSVGCVGRGAQGYFLEVINIFRMEISAQVINIVRVLKCTHMSFWWLFPAFTLPINLTFQSVNHRRVFPL